MGSLAASTGDGENAKATAAARAKTVKRPDDVFRLL